MNFYIDKLSYTMKKNIFRNQNKITSNNWKFILKNLKINLNWKMLWEIINFGFKGSDKFYIRITKYGVQWVKVINKCNVTFDKTFLKLALNFLLNQRFFSFGNFFFRQVIGIYGHWSNLLLGKPFSLFLWKYVASFD